MNIIAVGPEYMIANALIALSEKGQSMVSFSKVRDIGLKIQRY